MHSLIRNLKKREGFTLIELMIVVAIIGILAAIAIPNFIKFQLRSKASEGKINLAAIRTAQESYFAEAGTYTAWSVLPTSVPGQAKVNWGGACPAVLDSTSPGYCFIGWAPEGDIYYQYGVNTNEALPEQSNSFSADAQSDIDGDLNMNVWGIQMPNIAGSFTAGAGPNGCADSDVRNVATNAAGLLGQVGPCGNVDNGRNVF